MSRGAHIGLLGLTVIVYGLLVLKLVSDPAARHRIADRGQSVLSLIRLDAGDETTPGDEQL